MIRNKLVLCTNCDEHIKCSSDFEDELYFTLRVETPKMYIISLIYTGNIYILNRNWIKLYRVSFVPNLFFQNCGFGGTKLELHIDNTALSLYRTVRNLII
jgi:hypothetical protein